MKIRPGLLTLLTDFGTADWFAGTMKGVILSRQPGAQIVDITHAIRSGDLRAAAFALAAAYRFFPPGTIHVAVVDPGVGTGRPAIAVESRDYLFVGPDNGVLSFALRRETIRRISRLAEPRYFLPAVSRTFEGRDVFAAVGAHLLAGVPVSRLGPPQKTFHQLDWPAVRAVGNSFRGEVVYLDKFGNALTNLENELVETSGQHWEIRRGQRLLCRVGSSYQSVPLEKPVAVPGSTGFLEVAINGGNAARKLGLRVGDALILACGRVVKR